MKTIEQIAAYILVNCRYADDSWEPNANNKSPDYLTVGWYKSPVNIKEKVDPFADTLEARKQADAIENWLFSSSKSASTWCGNLWDDSRAAVYDLGGERRQWRLDRIKWCLEQLRNK